MSWYNSLKDLTGDIGHAAKGVGHAVGSVASNPLVDLGASMFLGPEAGAILGGIGGALKPGGGLGSAIKQGGIGALGGLAGGALSHIPGLGAAEGALSHLPGAGAVEGAFGDAKNALGQLPGVSQAEQYMQQHGGLGGLMGKAGSFLTGNGGANALGAAGAINAAMLQSKANDYAKNALGQVEQSYNERAPLRTGGMQAMQSALAANPFSGTAMPPRQPNALGTAPQQRPVTLGGY